MYQDFAANTKLLVCPLQGRLTGQKVWITFHAHWQFQTTNVFIHSVIIQGRWSRINNYQRVRLHRSDNPRAPRTEPHCPKRNPTCCAGSRLCRSVEYSNWRWQQEFINPTILSVPLLHAFQSWYIPLVASNATISTQPIHPSHRWPPSPPFSVQIWHVHPFGQSLILHSLSMSKPLQCLSVFMCNLLVISTVYPLNFSLFIL